MGSEWGKGTWVNDTMRVCVAMLFAEMAEEADLLMDFLKRMA